MKPRMIVMLIVSVMWLAARPNAVMAGDPAALSKKQMRQQWEAKVQAIHRQLDLSPAQEQQLEANRLKYQDQKEELYGQICDTRSELNAEFRKADYDRERMNQLHARIVELKELKEQLRFESLLAVRKILSTEQFQEFMRLKEELKPRHKK